MLCCVLYLVAQSCLTLSDRTDCSLPGSSVHGTSPGKNTGVDCHALLQEIFPTQVSNPGPLHCRQILYLLNHQRSPLKRVLVIKLLGRKSSLQRSKEKQLLSKLPILSLVAEKIHLKLEATTGIQIAQGKRWQTRCCPCPLSGTVPLQLAWGGNVRINTFLKQILSALKSVCTVIQLKQLSS